MITKIRQWVKQWSKKWTKKYVAEWLFALIVFVFMMFLAGGLISALEIKGLESSEAAGWTQAIGSIAAVVAAYFIANHQSKSSLEAIANAQKLAENFKKNGTLAVVRAANTHATNIGNAVASDSPVQIYEVYDKSIINGVVAALSAAPLYELGSTNAVIALLALRDQFVFLGNAVETYIAGPWQDEDIRRMLESLPAGGPANERAKAHNSVSQQYAKNVQDRVAYIHSRCDEIQIALTP